MTRDEHPTFIAETQRARPEHALRAAVPVGLVPARGRGRGRGRRHRQVPPEADRPRRLPRSGFTRDRARPAAGDLPDRRVRLEPPRRRPAAAAGHLAQLRAAVVPRGTRRCGSTTSPPPPSRIMRAARSPSSCSGRLTDVRSTSRAGRVSSIPASDTRPGMSTPARRSPVSRPIATSSLTARIASGSSPAASSASAAASPASYSKPPGQPRGLGARRRHRLLESLEAVRAGVQPGRALDERDPAVAERRAGARSRRARRRGCRRARSGSRGRARRARPPRSRAPACPARPSAVRSPRPRSRSRCPRTRRRRRGSRAARRGAPSSASGRRSVLHTIVRCPAAAATWSTPRAISAK